MQFLIVRYKRQTIRTKSHKPGEYSRVTQGMEFDDIENVVVESGNIADATAYGMLGKLETAEVPRGYPSVDTDTQMALTQYKVINVFPLEGCTKNDGIKLNQLGEAGGMSLEDASNWANFGTEEPS